MEEPLGSSTSRDLPFSSEELSEHVPTSSDSNSQNHVPQKNLTFDVKEILNSHEEGVKIVEKYQADVAMPVTEKDQHTNINIALGHVIRIVGHYYPEASTKEKLAAAIRLRKAALTPDQRKRKSVEKPKDDARKGKGESLKKSSPAEQPLSDEYLAQCKSKVAWLQNCGVFLENKSKIMEYMDETYEYRKYQIVNFLLTPTAIVTEFPRFLDVDFGRLIIADYVHQYPKSSYIGTFMSKYGNRLIRLALYNYMEIQESTDGTGGVCKMDAKNSTSQKSTEHNSATTRNFSQGKH
ncbi:hypothetical protein OUZ56_009820 [Daphnia magna]|uniref:Uncharacterized protein n=1 Tax=Daphnia magna TaxID=35525 RepID=A0ABR0AH57_9CRUS|nr:hypothetical protein OUZ56_009820 [Daphnia magna]